VGIVVAAVLYRRPPSSQASDGPGRDLLARAYGVDALVDLVIVRPIAWFSSVVLDRGVEVGVDRTFRGGGGLLARAAALVGSRLQDGDVGKYAWMLVAGAVALIAALLVVGG